MAVLPPKCQELPADIRSQLEQFYEKLTSVDFWVPTAGERKSASTALKNYLKRLQYFGVYESDEIQWVDDLEAAKAAHQASLKSAALDESRELAFKSIQSTSDLHGRAEALGAVRNDVRTKVMQSEAFFFTASDRANAADDASLAAAWLVVSDIQLEPSPFAPLLEIWEQGFWPIGPLAGKFVIYTPTEEIRTQRRDAASAAAATAAPAPEAPAADAPAASEPSAPTQKPEAAANSGDGVFVGPAASPPPDNPVPSGDGWSIQMNWGDSQSDATAANPASAPTGGGLQIGGGAAGPNQTMEMYAATTPQVTVKTEGLPASKAQQDQGAAQTTPAPQTQPAPAQTPQAAQPTAAEQAAQQQLQMQIEAQQQQMQQLQMQMQQQQMQNQQLQQAMAMQAQQAQVQQQVQQQHAIQQQQMQQAAQQQHMQAQASQQQLPSQPPPNMGMGAQPYDPLAEGSAVVAPPKSKAGLYIFLLLLLLGGGGGGYYFYANSPGVLYQEATKLLNDKKFAEAAKLLDVILKKDAKLPGARRDLGIAYMEMKKDSDALSAFKLATITNPKDGVSMLYLGYLYSKEGKYSDALTALQSATKLQPQDGVAFHNLGQVQFMMGQLNAARASFQQATKLKSDLADAWNDLGSTYLHEAQRLAAQKAEPMDRKCTSKPPPPELVRVAKEAETAFRQAILHAKGTAKYHQNLGASLQLQQQFPNAQAEYQKGLASKSTHPGLLNDMGVLMLQQCKYQDAVRFLMQAVPGYESKYRLKQTDHNKAKYAATLYNAAVALEGIKDGKQRAAIMYKQYITLMPNDADGFCRFGQTLKNIKKRDLAIKAYLRCYQLTKNADEQKKVKRSLRRLGYRKRL